MEDVKEDIKQLVVMRYESNHANSCYSKTITWAKIENLQLN